MEYWDLYNKDRIKLNKKHLRGKKINPGEFYIIVSGWIINDENKILLTQRHPKKSFPLTWEGCKGALITGEDSITGILREIEEEIGIRLKINCGKIVHTEIENDYNIIRDIYIFRENLNIMDIKLQETETVNAKWVTINEFSEMIENGQMGPSAIKDIEIIKMYLNINK